MIDALIKAAAFSPIINAGGCGLFAFHLGKLLKCTEVVYIYYDDTPESEILDVKALLAAPNHVALVINDRWYDCTGDITYVQLVRRFEIHPISHLGLLVKDDEYWGEYGWETFFIEQHKLDELAKDILTYGGL